MSSSTQHATPDSAPRLAASARAVLACPESVSLVVDSVPHALEGADDLAMQDAHGTPTFLCPVGRRSRRPPPRTAAPC